MIRIATADGTTTRAMEEKRKQGAGSASIDAHKNKQCKQGKPKPGE